MGKIKINSKKLEENLNKRFNEFKNDTESLTLFGKRLVRNIVADARDGINYKGENFPSLSSAWIKRKARLAEFNAGKTSRFYQYSKSNVNFFGDLLKGVGYKFGGMSVTLKITGKHRAIKGVRGKTLEGSNSKLADIYDGLENRDERWGFLGVSKKSSDYLRTLFIRFIRRKL